MSIITLKNILYDLGMEELLDSSFKDDIKILEWNVEDNLFFFEFKKGYAWYIIEGGVVTTTHFSGEKELFWELKKGTWTGLPDAILNILPEHDMKVLRGTKVLEIPLHDILLTDEVSKNFYKRMLIEFANTIKPAVKNAAARMKCGDEVYFLKYLESNNFKIKFTSIKDLAELLNVNLRTFHRILKKLIENNIIIKEVYSIEVINPKIINKYIKEIND